MPKPAKRLPRWICLALVTAAAPFAAACRVHKETPGPLTQKPAGEPQQYSATVARTIDDGARVEITLTRMARSGEMLRVEWDQDGESRASIWRPDLAKVFLLSLDRRLYVESDLYPDRPQAARTRAPSGSGDSSATGRVADSVEGRAPVEPGWIDRAFEVDSEPERVETQAMPDEVVGGRSCLVLRRRASFAGGTIETTTQFHARDLEGLAVRVESETDGPMGRVKIVTERRDIRTEVSPDQFVIPSAFRRVDSLDVGKL